MKTLLIAILAILTLILVVKTPIVQDVSCTSHAPARIVDDDRTTGEEFSTMDLRRLYDTLREVETGGHPDPYNALGDGGRSLGPYQIGRAYHADAIEHDPSLYAIEYEGVRDGRIAEMIMLAYFERYVSTPWTYESLARTHNGGPKGRFRASTDPYWSKCKRILDPAQ